MNLNDNFYTRDYVERKGRTYASATFDFNSDWVLVNALGIPMYARKHDGSVTPCLVKDGYWEPWITAWFLNNISDNHLFIDIGANTGYYSMIAADKGSHVIAYEPNPPYVEMLRESIKLGWGQTRGDWLPDSHFNVYECAVSDKVGTAILTVPELLQGSATITDADLSAYNPHSLEVSTVSLDYHMAGTAVKPTLIKVDAEGAEELVWDGAFETNYRHRPVWMMEYTPGAYGPLFLDKLESYGDLHWINHDGVEEPIAKGPVLEANDWLMLVIRPKD